MYTVEYVFWQEPDGNNLDNEVIDNLKQWYGKIAHLNT